MAKESWIMNPTNLKSVFQCAPQVLKVLKIFESYNHKNIQVMAPRICSKLKEINIEVINEALTIYQRKASLERKAPHPNYFITTALRLQEAQGKDGSEPPLIMGKTI